MGTLAAIGIGGWQLSLTPSLDRSWSRDQAILPSAEVHQDSVTVRNIRNFIYRSADDYTIRFYDRTFLLDDIRSVDYIIEPFGSIGAAHAFLSFGFANDTYVAISVEIRKEEGESFSPFKGVLRQYELMYVIADERDVIGLRANHRHHDVYVYPTLATSEDARRLFRDMLARANTLHTSPEFYNTLTNNCAINVARHVNRACGGIIPRDIRLLLPANSDRLARELGLIPTDIPIEEARRRHRVNERAKTYADHEFFSRAIRETAVIPK